MKLIKEIQEQDVNSDAPTVDDRSFRTREAARAIVFDADGKVALLYVGKHNYHKLPGGGIDSGEDIHTALARELMEEIGCSASVTGEVGEIIEHRNQFELIQKSYCFTATVSSKNGQPDFTEKEIDEGFSIVWADNLVSAIELLENDTPKNYEGEFIRIRDLAFLRTINQ